MKAATKIKSFIYNGMTITGKRKFTASEKRKGLRLSLNRIGINVYEDAKISWDYEKFYEVARLHGQGEYDVFEYNGIEVVPGSNELFELDNTGNSKLFMH